MGPPPDPDAMLRMLENPQFQSTLNEALSNPQVVDMMIQQNPMLRDMGPNVRQMLQSPFFRRMLTDPAMIRQMTEMQRSLGMGPFGGGVGGGNAAFPAPGVTNTTPEENRDQNQPNQGTQQNTQNPFSLFGMPGMAGQGAGEAAGNPFAALFGGFPPAPGSGGNASGTNASIQPSNNRPAQDAGTTSSTGATGTPVSTEGTNAQNPFAALFNPALFANPGANPNGQQPQNPSNPFMNNPFLQNPALFEQMLQGMTGQTGQDAASNPLAALLGGMAPSQPPDNRPPEERYATQLSQLNDMGFFDFDRNVEALRRAGGNVQGAVEYLLSNP